MITVVAGCFVTNAPGKHLWAQRGHLYRPLRGRRRRPVVTGFDCRLVLQSG